MENKDKLLQEAQKRIRKLASGFSSQQEFADYCGISKYSLSQYMNGTNAPGNVNAAKIARRFLINPLWIMGFDVPMRVAEDENRIERYEQLANALNERAKHREALGISQDEWDLISAFRMLNEAGKAKVLEHAVDLTYIEKYKNEDVDGFIRL